MISESKMRRLFQDLKSDKRGVTMIEYALIAGLVSIVAIALLAAMGTSVKSIYSSVNDALTTA
jgi:pilus assembly protein Flp/PilA